MARRESCEGETERASKNTDQTIKYNNKSKKQFKTKTDVSLCVFISVIVRV